MSTDFTRVLVANRGEIALRIIRACRDAGLTSVAVYADPDADAPFVRAADQAVSLGGSTSAETYLDLARILDAAAQSGADAVHPGYGFLAENADFARAVVDAGLVWIGPPAEVISALGDKVRARAIAEEAGAPLAPGTKEPVADAEEAVAFAREHGLPLAIKAAHGGGGRGLRVARDQDEVAHLFDAAVREATAAFGRGECFLESYIEKGRHVEVQVLADTHGAVQILGTRDCSLQRRYQKVVEEAPAPFLTAQQRTELEDSAAAICRAAGYVNAGTVEFLLSPEGRLAFLEVNTRLQVEHSVTEETVDIDVVRAQLRIAAGERLDPGEQRQDGSPGHLVVQPRRHALEFRINAEDPDHDFTPSTGTITGFCPPGGPGVRLDSGVRTGSEISGQFDSLLAKLVVTGRDRTEALERARRALAEFEITGVRTTLPFLRAVLLDPAFTAEGPKGFSVHTGWIEEEHHPDPAAGADQDEQPDASKVRIQIGNRWLDVSLPVLEATVDGPLAQVREQARERLREAGPAGNGVISAPMQGTVVKVAVSDGDEVEAGEVLVVIEAMKMENPVRATQAGRIEGLGLSVGETVAQGEILGHVHEIGQAQEEVG